MSVSATVMLCFCALASRISSRIKSSSTLSLAESASSGEGVCAGFEICLNAFSTSFLVIALPSTTAQVSGDTAAGAEEAAGEPERQATVRETRVRIASRLTNGRAAGKRRMRAVILLSILRLAGGFGALARVNHESDAVDAEHTQALYNYRP